MPRYIIYVIVLYIFDKYISKQNLSKNIYNRNWELDFQIRYWEMVLTTDDANGRCWHDKPALLLLSELVNKDTCS